MPSRRPPPKTSPPQAPRAPTPELQGLLDAVRALHEALTAFDQGAAHALEVNRSDLQALLMLEHGPRPARDLSRALGLSSGATTALVDRLERAGLVQRSASESDRRVTLVGLSAPAFRRIGGLYAGLFRAFVGSVETAPAHHLEAATQVLRTLALTCQEAAALAREGR